ncbi:MAG: NAD-dependent epimerase/dehydratase family protein [Salaquimonas sp.]|nr:NAD-dependent epimerase/dehydratase family protein [Salaquimonas sp.]
MTTLVTGAAGFIGYHTTLALLARGEDVIGVDNLNDYYPVQLKRDRLARLANEKGFSFVEADIADMDALNEAVAGAKVTHIVHLAAQAGVRYSLENPAAYASANLVGHLNMLELARHTDTLEHMCYASSSSVYGGRTDLPFLETDRVDRPVSLYAATKCADELMSHTYAHLYHIPLTGLRFFTVYGPWGRPDMAYWSFTQKIIAGKAIKVFNHGDMLRDFTYIDDIVDGVARIVTTGQVGARDVPHAIYNIGNNHPEKLDDFIAVLENVIGRKAVREGLPMQPGDVPATYADITAIRKDYGFEPKTDLATGLSRFVAWYRQHFDV